MVKAGLTCSNFLKKGFFAVLFIVVNSFSWYFPLYFFLKSALEFQIENSIFLMAISIHYIGAICFAFAGVALAKKLSRINFLSLWTLIGAISSAFLLTFDISNVACLLLVSFLLGVSLGLGFPSCLAYFGNYTIEENRGRHGGITFFVSGLGMLFIGLLTSVSTFFIGALIFTLLRGLGLILFYVIEPKHQKDVEEMTEISYKAILGDRFFVLYFVPWVMFCLVNFLELPIITNFIGEDLALLIIIAEYGVGGFSALVSGWFADSVGRKRIVIFGFIILGIGYAVLGLLSGLILSWYLYIVFDGIAWGIFCLMFFFVIWADLAKNRAKEKYYLLGTLPFIFAGYVQVLFTPYAKSIPIYVAFSLASFFLFLAVLPLLYASETLSEKEIEKKRLQKYLESAKKIREKYHK